MNIEYPIFYSNFFIAFICNIFSPYINKQKYKKFQNTDDI